MDGAWERALDNSRLLKLFSKRWKQKHVFIIISIPKFFDGISNFLDANCTQKQADTDRVFYFVMPHEIRSCEK